MYSPWWLPAGIRSAMGGIRTPDAATDEKRAWPVRPADRVAL